MKSKEKKVDFTILGLFIILYGCYFNAIKSISLSYIVTLIISFAFLLLGYILHKDEKVNINIGFLLIIAMFFTSLIYTKSEQSSFRMIITYVLFFLISIFLEYNDDLWKKLKIILLTFSSISLVVTIISFISPTFYVNNILSSVYEGSQNQMYNLVMYAHSFPGIFASTGLNAYFLSIGYFIVLIDIIILKDKKIVRYLILFLYILGIFLTLKRVALCLDILITFVIFHLMSNKSQKFLIERKKIRNIMIILITVGIFAILFKDVLLNLITRIFASDDILNGRTELYDFALKKIYSNPLVGNGINSFPILYSYYGGELLSTHNEFLQLTYELGLFQSVFIFCWLFFNFVKTQKILYMIKDNNNQNNIMRSFILLSLAVQLYFIMYCLTGNPFHDMNIFGIYIIVVILSFSIRKEINNEK